MPAKITIASNASVLNSVQRQTVKAAAVALTRTGWDVQRALTAGMASTFDRPTPFTMRAFRVEMANASNLVATVWAAPIQARYLFWQIEGGDRATKGFERRMHLFGGQVALPSAGAKLNAYGNMSLAFIKRATAGGNGSRFFTGRPHNQPNATEGVWERTAGGKLKMVMHFSDEAHYNERFEMADIAERTVGQRFQGHLVKALQAFYSR